MLINYLAHAGESHGDAVETARHAVDLNPWTASLLIIAIGVLIPFILFNLTKSHGLAIIVSLTELLVIGILTYSVLPILSAIALVVGFTLTLILVFYSM